MTKFSPFIVSIAAVVATACSAQPGALTAPSAVATDTSAVSTRVHANLTAPLVSDACKPPTNSVVFDPTQLGRVSITNNSPCTNEFLYIVWKVSPQDESNQTLIAAQGARLAPGESRTLTVGFPEGCGTKYQRDVYIGLSDDKPNYSFSDMSNYFFAALGYYQYGSSCAAPPPSNPPSTPPSNPVQPPVDRCPNLEGNQPSVPEGLTLVDGVCVPVIPPVDVCPNIEGYQAAVPAGLALVGGLCVPAVIPVDVCPNLDGLQLTVPAGYSLVGGTCALVPPPPALCTDAAASNFGGLAPCSYPPPSTPACGPFTFSGPMTVNVPNGINGRLAYARSFGPEYANIVAVQPPHGGNFADNNRQTFTFTPSQNYAVVIFHQAGGGRDAFDIVFTGVVAGVPLSVPTDGGDVYYFNCPQ